MDAQEKDEISSPSKLEEQKATASESPKHQIEEFLQKEEPSLKKVKAGHLAYYKRLVRNVEELMLVPENLQMVKSKKDELCNTFKKYYNANEQFMDSATEEEREKASSVCVTVQHDYKNMVSNIERWLERFESKGEIGSELLNRDRYPKSPSRVSSRSHSIRSSSSRLSATSRKAVLELKKKQLIRQQDNELRAQEFKQQADLSKLEDDIEMAELEEKLNRQERENRQEKEESLLETPNRRKEVLAPPTAVLSQAQALAPSVSATPVYDPPSVLNRPVLASPVIAPLMPSPPTSAAPLSATTAHAQSVLSPQARTFAPSSTPAVVPSVPAPPVVATSVPAPRRPVLHAQAPALSALLPPPTAPPMWTHSASVAHDPVSQSLTSNVFPSTSEGYMGYFPQRYQDNVPHLSPSYEDFAASVKDSLTLPKPDLMSFSGDPTDYFRFISTFEANIANRVRDDRLKLAYLIQYCSGDAKESISDCVILDPAIGYNKAREILLKRFGKPHIIARAYINQLTDGSMIKSSDSLALTKLSMKMEKCLLTLSHMGYAVDLDNCENLLKITRILPICM